jgi:hypothetical protein
MCFRMFPRLSSTSPRNLYCHMIDLFLVDASKSERSKEAMHYICVLQSMY